MVELHTLSPRPRELTAEEPAGGNVLARQQPDNLSSGCERPIEGGKLGSGCRRALPWATAGGALTRRLCEGEVGE